MKKLITTLTALVIMASTPLYAQVDWSRLVSGAKKATQAMVLTDYQMQEYVKSYMEGMDKENTVVADSDPYAIRLKKLTQGLTEVEGIPLNFKVYKTDDVNAFACADGSVRVYTSLMDIMTDDELLGVIGHEVGHVALKHSRKAFKTALLTSALRDGLASNGGAVARLSDAQIGDLSETLVNSRFSQKQEKEADDYGYEFLKKNGKNPWAMAMSFQRLKTIEDQAGVQNINIINQLFSSHPNLKSRISRMEKRAKKDGFAKP